MAPDSRNGPRWRSVELRQRMRKPDLQRWHLGDGLVADARRALWHVDDRTLVVGDVHLGYVWVERRRGALLPLVPDDTVTRLRELVDDYQPRRCVFLGDTVHATAALEPLREELGQLWSELGPRCELEFVLGNHDARLPELLAACGRRAVTGRRLRTGRHLLIHGDGMDLRCAWEDERPSGWTIYGHEHPALHLSDGVASGVRVPCFVVGDRRVVLPAFSRWAAGQVIGRDAWLSPLSDTAGIRQFLAILGDRLLPLPKAVLER